MPFELDADIAEVFGAAVSDAPRRPLPPRGDAIAMRNSLDAVMRVMNDAEPDSPGVTTTDHLTPVAGGEILIYPMLDDRTVEPDPELVPRAAWSYEDNFTCWTALLGSDRGGAGVSPWSAPARLADFTRLAPAFIDVGELDIYRDESVRYASNLWQAGVSAELHVRHGCPHGFDRGAGAAAVSKRSWADRCRVIRAL